LDILIEEKILLSKKAEQDQESKTAVGSKREKLKKIESVITRLKVLKSDLVSKALLRNALSDLLKKDQIRIHRISLVGDDVVVPEQSSVVF
jgi:hypothetical protein